MTKNNRCEFYPTDTELHRDGPFCRCSSDVSGKFICTKEYSKTCQWANERRSKIPKCTMFDKICKDMEKRIGTQIDSRCASNDEVRICWLITEVERLRKIVSLSLLEDPDTRTLFDIADQTIEKTYPDTNHKGNGWWGEQRVPRHGILRRTIVDALVNAAMETVKLINKKKE